jgi:hypothetical protein
MKYHRDGEWPLAEAAQANHEVIESTVYGKIVLIP